MSNIWKEQMGGDDIISAMSKVGKASRDHGIQLEGWLYDDVLGVIRGFRGYDLYNPNKPNTIPRQQKEYFDYKGGFVTSDAVCFNNPSDRPAFVIESKGTCNENMYGVWAVAQLYTRRDIPYILVTKDRKGTFKTGKSKYLNFLKDLDVKIFINNHNNYDDDKQIVHFWEDYAFNDIVRPYSDFSSYISKLVASHKQDHSVDNQFYAWTS